MLVSFNNVDFDYAGHAILGGITFSVNEGERIALIGENGAGKTTLLNLLCGRLSPSGGSVARKVGASFGFLEQNGGLDGEGTVYSQMMEAVKPQTDAVARLAKLSQELSAAEYGSREYIALSSKYENLQKYIDAHDCYNAEVRVKTVLGGMGFSGVYQQKVSTMSGGEKTRLKLARLLLEEPDLLILDEPTNHLDIKTLFWLEDYLASFKGAVLVVSHDRYFIDKIAERILEIEDKKLYSYKGNYTKYKTLKEERLALWHKEYERQIEERARLQDYVDRNIVRATTAKSAQSRVKQLEKMELIEKPYVPPAPPKFSFTFTQPSGEVAVEAEDMPLEAGGRVLAQSISIRVKRGARLAIVGENGAGKSTLLKALLSGNPHVRFGRYARPALYDQENLNLNPANTVLAEMWERHVLSSQTDVRAALARSGLVAEDMDKKVANLSGGERAKLALCVLQGEEANLLLLDEPTNHLDLPARESLEAALKSYEGTLVFVSHDRYFISALADSVAELSGGRLTIYEGGYEGYRNSVRLREQEEEAAARAVREAKYAERREGSYRSKKARAEEEAHKARLKQIEADISSNERMQEELNTLLSDPSVAADYKKLAELCRQLEELKERETQLYSEYEKLI